MEEIPGWAQVSIAGMVTVAVLLLALLIRPKSRRSAHKLPPGPRGWPLLGNMPSLGTLPNQSLYELSKQYGPLMLLRLGSVRILVVSSRKTAEEILKTHDKIMASRPVHIVPSIVLCGPGGDMAWAPYGDYWRYLRKVATVGVLTARRLNQFREIREREVLATLHFILEESQRGIAVDMFEMFSALTSNSISQMMMNKSYSVLRSASEESVDVPSTSPSLGESFIEMFEILGQFNLADFVPLLKPFDPQGLYKRAKKVKKQLDGFLDEIIKEHQERPLSEAYKEDFVDALLAVGKTKELLKITNLPYRWTSLGKEPSLSGSFTHSA